MSRETSLWLHNLAMDSVNSVRDIFGLPPKTDYGCIYDQNERFKRNQIESMRGVWYDEENDEYISTSNSTHISISITINN